MTNALWIVCLPTDQFSVQPCKCKPFWRNCIFAWQIRRTSANCSLRSSLLSDVSSVYLSYAFCKRSLMRESSAKAFVRGDGHVIMYPFSILGTHFSASSCPFLFGWNACVFWTVWKVMEMCYKILGEGKLVHQRELFYKLLSESPKYFSCQRHVNRAIQGQQNPPLHLILAWATCTMILIRSRIPMQM